MQALPFVALQAAGETIPDAVFEKIPYAGPKWFKEPSKDNRTSRHHDRDRRKEGMSNRYREERSPDTLSSASHSDNNCDASSHPSRTSRSRRRVQRPDHRQNRRGRGYDSDHGTPYSPDRRYNNVPYFPPPPIRPVDDPEYNVPPPELSTSQSHSDYAPDIVPSEYAAPPLDFDHHESRQSMPNYRDYSKGMRDSSVRPRDQKSTNSEAVMLHPDTYAPYPSDDVYTEYQPSRSHEPWPIEDELSDYEEPRRRYQRSRSDSRTSRNNSRSRSRSHNRAHSRHRVSSHARSRGSARERNGKSDVAVKVKDNLEKHMKELGIGALGAIAGGIIGNELGGKNGKMGILIGAALGGIGGGIYENRSEDKRGKQRSERRSSRRKSRDGYDSY